MNRDTVDSDRLLSVKGFLQVPLALTVAPMEELLLMRENNYGTEGSHVLHESAHAQSIVGTAFYSSYALSTIKGNVEAGNEILDPMRPLLEAVPSVIRRFGG